MNPALLALAFGVLVVVVVGLRLANRRQQVRRRLFVESGASVGAAATTTDADTGGRVAEGGMAGWLSRAGLRGRDSVRRFWLWSLLAASAGALAVWLTSLAGIFGVLDAWLVETPGGLGDAFRPILAAAPWIVFTTFACLPMLRVRARRRTIVATVERDLPLVLELLASLAQAGLGFDAALERVVAAFPPGRPLRREFATFRADLLAGAARAVAMRRLAARLDMPRVSTFLSALIQSERLGSALADTLRVQAEDLRNARRETALARAQALPARLVFPLVICFLPGVFVMTLGPAFFSFLNGPGPGVPIRDANR